MPSFHLVSRASGSLPGYRHTLSRMDGRLIRSAVEVNWRNLALGHDVFEADGATFVRNLALPAIYDANFVFGITVAEPTASIGCWRGWPGTTSTRRG